MEILPRQRDCDLGRYYEADGITTAVAYIFIVSAILRSKNHRHCLIQGAVNARIERFIWPCARQNMLRSREISRDDLRTARSQSARAAASQTEAHASVSSAVRSKAMR